MSLLVFLMFNLPLWDTGGSHNLLSLWVLFRQFAASKKKKGGLDTQTVLMGLAGVTVLFAIVLFLKAPESPTGGASDSRNLLIQGINYLNGEGVTKDEEKAVEFLKRSAALGQPEAQHRLGYIYTYGTEAIEADPALAYDYYIKGQISLFQPKSRKSNSKIPCPFSQPPSREWLTRW